MCNLIFFIVVRIFREIVRKLSRFIYKAMFYRDGSFICIGKGNEDWNDSAPHGAGRVMSRTKAKAVLTMKDFESSMQGIYTTSVNRNTLDEAPFAYKPFQEIMENIQDTVDIIKRLKPVYNFKAAE